MKTLDEVKWYCKEQNPVGALLITGKWGCGKTYLVEHSIAGCADIKCDYAMIRVSLFGETSVDSIRKKVKQAYISSKFFTDNASGGDKGKVLKGLNLVGKAGLGIATVLGKFSPIGEAAGAVLSLNWLDFFEISNEIGDKKLLLIFDDLERSNMQMQDLLGCLNEYVETKKIKTILIADEEKITTREDTSNIGENSRKESKIPTNGEVFNPSYAILKEKIISRTVKHVPENAVIVEEVIKEYIETVCGYKVFLLNNVAIVQRVFHDSETNNIRSLKCAIQDFDRIYGWLNKYDFSDEAKSYFFGSFLVLEFEFKADNLNNDRYGYLLIDSGLSEKYSDFKSRYILETCRHWLTTGDWIQEDINSELQTYKEKLRSEKPEDIVLRSLLIDLDDKIFEEGFPIAIEKGYAGQLLMDDYISILRMRIEARHFTIIFPVEVDLSLLYQAIEQRIEKIKDGTIEEPKGHLYIADKNVAEFLEDEAKIYELIEEFRDFEQHYINRVVFMKALESKDEKIILECFKKYYKSFDEELTNKVFDYYKDLENISKRILCSAFLRAWRNANVKGNDIDVTISGLKKLSDLVKFECSEAKIKGAIDREFIKNLREIAETYSRKVPR